MTTQELEKLALNARDLEWGSAEQIDAENDFFIEIESRVTPENFQRIEDYAFKATTPERVEFAIDVLTMERFISLDAGTLEKFCFWNDHNGNWEKLEHETDEAYKDDLLNIIKRWHEEENLHDLTMVECLERSGVLPS